MKLSRRRQGVALDRIGVISIASLLTLVALIPLSRAQDATHAAPPTSTAIPASAVETDRGTSVSTDSTTLVAAHSTPSLTAGTPTEPSPQVYPTATNGGDEPLHDASVFNYYFLFLAAFGIVIAGLLWWFHLRRKRQKQQRRLSGQHALARDLEGWAGARRFMHGGYARYQTARVPREEGLNEDGEAPPPYQPKSEVTVEAVPEAGSGPAVPLQSLARSENDRIRPPGYTVNARAHGS